MGISHSCVLVWLCLVQALIIADSYERVYGGSIRCNHNWYTLPLPPDIWRPLPNIQHPELCLAELMYAKTYWIVIRDQRLHRSSYYRSIQDHLSSCNLYPFESDPAYWLLKPRGTFCRRDSDGDVEADGQVLVLHQPQVDRLVLRELVLLLAVDLQVVKVHVDPATVAEKACK